MRSALDLSRCAATSKPAFGLAGVESQWSTISRLIIDRSSARPEAFDLRRSELGKTAEVIGTPRSQRLVDAGSEALPYAQWPVRAQERHTHDPP